ncbi:PREDICTED: polygalacturonase inhibitor 1-like [Camelina sativa]|uniref:Polygalacturonase inhibitor 1-like n=1 Tax=Camelina sativa TaxID=90675 RepID=A0ABM0XJJ5_CAMSA|nr:PREDICTED: polygalacturonase inhibitor 1-like [Camelina sativa]
MKLLLLHVSIFFSILFISLQSSYSCTPNDKNALLQIKKSLNNPPLLSSWNPRTDCCTSWTGVECTDGRVTALTISSGEISGQIPVQIGDLSDLRTLDFSYLTHLTGNIPRTITKLKNLDLLRLKQTNLSGPIPDYISELKTVTFLDLSFNQFTGPIPGSLSQMPKLQAIQVNDNKLTGSIPNSFGSFVGNVPNLYLFNNKLSGKVPESLSKYDFNAVDLSGNGFIGDGSMFFGRNKTTVRVDLSRNLFQFDLSKVKFARSIVSLDLSHNRIFGKFPRELSKLRLENFNVSYNHLCGKIPSGGLLQTFEPSAFAHNLCLCGTPLKAC